MGELTTLLTLSRQIKCIGERVRMWSLEIAATARQTALLGTSGSQQMQLIALWTANRKWSLICVREAEPLVCVIRPLSEK